MLDFYPHKMPSYANALLVLEERTSAATGKSKKTELKQKAKDDSPAVAMAYNKCQIASSTAQKTFELCLLGPELPLPIEFELVVLFGVSGSSTTIRRISMIH